MAPRVYPRGVPCQVKPRCERPAATPLGARVSLGCRHADAAVRPDAFLQEVSFRTLCTHHAIAVRCSPASAPASRRLREAEDSKTCREKQPSNKHDLDLLH